MNSNLNRNQNNIRSINDMGSIAAIVKEAMSELKKQDSDIVAKLCNREPSIAYEVLTQALKVTRESLTSKSKINSVTSADNLKNVEAKLTYIVNKVIDSVNENEKVEIIGRINDLIAYNIDPNVLNKAKNTVSDIPEIMSNKLMENECIIFRIDNAEFKTPNRSLVGDHILFISNKGRVFVYDSGGFLGQPTVQVSRYPINVSFLLGICFESDIRESFSYNCKISTDSFIKLLNKICIKCFNFDDEDEDSIIKADRDDYIGELIIDTEKITAENFQYSYNFDIYYKHIQEYDYSNAVLNIKGHFTFKYEQDREKTYKEISLFIPNEDNLENLKKFFSNRNSILSIVPEGAEIMYGTLTGFVNDTFYNKQDIAVAKKDNIIIFINIDLMKTISGLRLDSINYYIEGSNVFLIQEESILVINLGNEYVAKFGLSEKSNLDNKLYRFGYTEEGYPFIFQINSEGVVFKQSASSIILNIENSQIKDISIKEFIEDSEFVKVNITKRSDENLIFYLYGKSVSELVKETFKNSKLELFDSLNVKHLFTSWARQINDILNYYYFGSLFCVKEEIDMLLEENDNILNYDDELKAVNILYYAVQEQKKQLETIGIYLPKLLEYNERDLMNRLGRDINSMPFKVLQKQLLSIAGQIQRSLNEIDRSLAQIPYAIYPDTNTRSITSNSRYRHAGTLGAVGAAGVILTGAFSLPFIVGSAVNIWNTYKMDKELEKVEKTKVDIYGYQAIDSFNHIMNIMIPYYIDEVNHALFYMFKQIAQYYTNFNDSDEVKMELIERISDLYTTKQLPISNFMLRPKKYVIEQIQAAINVDIGGIKNDLIKGGVESV
ncbi:hypothetical protein [Clostridium prolinivorans]|uniref:hypothetical protein n=1 Tax=Clostridium prolinivorans TaxID=2769420 RepID=UPI000FDC2CFF|nr:hypothetical protein [Clostridium prolinivorans]